MRKLVALVLVLVLALTTCVVVSAEELSLEELKNMFALSAETEGKSAEELYAMGQAYELGDGVTQWYAMAKAYYEAALQAGSDEAVLALEKLEAYKQQVLANSPDGQGEIFDFFRTGAVAGQEGDYSKAYAVNYDDAFFFEDPLLRGIGSLGDLLRDGNGIAKDIDMAVAIYEFNAKVLGKGNGYTALGQLYSAEDGTYEGITHSDEKAMSYFQLSYQDKQLTETDFKGPRYAADLFDSGYVLDDGTVVPADYVSAEAGYLIAAAGNGRTFDGTACVKLGIYYEEGREGVAQDMAKAVQYDTLALSDKNVHGTMLGIPQVCLTLGRCYEEGKGVDANKETAIQYYTLARDYAQDNLDLVNAAGNNDEMAALQEEAVEALARLAQ